MTHKRLCTIVGTTTLGSRFRELESFRPPPRWNLAVLRPGLHQSSEQCYNSLEAQAIPGMPC